jgi:hypothetical protein
MDNTKYIFNREGVEEDVPLEVYKWVATYKDGSELKQFDKETGIFHQVGEIQQDKLARFTMICTEEEKIKHTISVPEGAKIIHKYNRYVFNAKRPDEIKLTIYIFGYKIGGHHHFNFILPDGNIVQNITGEIRAEDGKWVY